MNDIPAWFCEDWCNTALRVDGMYGARFGRGQRFRGSRRDMWALLSVLEGSLRVGQGGWTADLKPGDQVLLRPNAAFTRLVLSEECWWSTIDFRVESTGLGRDPLPALGLPAAVHTPLTPEEVSLHQKGIAVYAQEGRARFVFAGRGIADLIVGRYLKSGLATGAIPIAHREAVPDWLSTTRERIAHSFMQRDVDIARMASDAGFSRFYFCRAFKQAFHVTPMEFLWEVRLQIAARRMDDDPFLPLNEVADLSGFANHTHFSRRFRRRFGMTPRKWRQRKLRPSPKHKT